MQNNSNNFPYNIDDFYRIDKIDAHVHINSMDSVLVHQSKADNFKLLSVNIDAMEFPSIKQQLAISEHLRKNNRDHLAFVSTFPMQGWDDPDWEIRTIKYLDQCFKRGAVAVKIWKNIGMEYKDNQDRFVMIDNPRFDSIFDHMRQKNIPILGHLGEPKDCWLPLKDISIKYIYDYFQSHPQYHMYLHPEYPSYHDQITARDHMLEKNRNLQFIAVHLASLEWDVHQVGLFLDSFSNANIDVSARLMYIQYQSIRNRHKVREFFLKYQNRIIYGSDIIQEENIDPNEFKKEIHKKWFEDWKYLATAEFMQSADIDEEFQGLALPHSVIQKIYKNNVEKLFPNAWN